MSEPLRLATAGAPEDEAAATALPSTVEEWAEYDCFPLSFSQRRLWFLHRLEPESEVYNLSWAIALDGALDATRLAAALRRIVGRHEILRTRFFEAGGRPLQQVLARAPLPLPAVDLAALPEGRRRAEGERIAARVAAESFDLGRAPALRVRLLRLAPGSHVLVIALHHVVCDGWSMGILVRELSAFYRRAGGADAPAALPELAIQYADFAAWQREGFEGAERERRLAPWLRRLRPPPPSIDLPYDRPPERLASPPAGRVRTRLAPERLTAARELGRRHGATLFMVLLAAFDALLHRWSGHDDLAVGTPVANRTVPEVEPLIGCFVNTLVLRVEVGAPPSSFLDLLGRVRAVALEAFEHQDVPFEALVEELAPERRLGANPLFQVFFALQNAPAARLELPGLTLSPREAPARSVGFDLSLTAVESDSTGDSGELDLELEYAADRFDRATIARLAGQLETLLAGAVAAPGRSLAELPLLSPAQSHQVRVEWVHGPAPESMPDRAQGALLDHARHRPDGVALVAEDERGTTRTFTYAGLARGAGAVAAALAEHGVARGDRVALCADRSPEMILGLLGILEAGAAYVPLDPSYPPERLSYMLEDGLAGVRRPLVLAQRGVLDRLGAIEPERARVVTIEEALARTTGGAARRLPRASGDDLAAVIYTSGSTGRPKGVALTHRGVAAFAHCFAGRVGFDRGDRGLQFAALSFDTAAEEIYTLWSAGGAVVLRPRELFPTFADFERFLGRHRITFVDLPSSYWHEWTVDLDRRDALPPDSVTRLAVGSEATAVDKLRLWQRRVGRRVWVINGYGPTEVTVAPVVHAPDPEEPVRGHRVVLIGRPIAGYRTFVLDRAMRPSPPGAIGELYLSGPSLARGYLGRPALTAERFVPDPIPPLTPRSPSLPQGGMGTPPPEPLPPVGGGRLYRTGDLARLLPDGSLEYAGRADQQVKVRGFRIEPGEIESVLLDHAGVDDAVVVARRDGDGAPRLVAYLVASRAGAEEPATPIDTESLARDLAATLPSHMVPTAFVVLDTLPRTPSGKVDRRSLPAPTHGHRAKRQSEPPRTPTEAVLAELWAEVLEIDRVGRRDRFFDLGGHSLLATRLVSRVRDRFGVELPLRALFETPDLAGLAAAIDRRTPAEDARGPEAPPLRPLPRREGEPLALSFAQRRLWFLDRLQPGLSAYVMAEAFAADGPLDPAALRRARHDVAARHEVLRTVYREVDGEPFQVVLPPDDEPVSVIDLAGLPEPDRERAARSAAAAAAEQPFDLAAERPLRCRVVRLGTERSILVVQLHHVAGDGWSVPLLVRELAARYAAPSGSGGAQPLPLQYSDYAAWQRSWLDGETLARELDAWRELLAEAPAALELPTDRPRPPRRRHRGREVAAPSPGEAIEWLRRASGSTPFGVALAGFAALLARLSGQDQVVVGSPVSGRFRTELEPMIGLLANTVALRIDCSGDPTFEQLAERARETLLHADEHQHLPFERLVEELAPVRDLSRSPIFQAMLLVDEDDGIDLDLPGLRLTRFPLDRTTTLVDLTLALRGRGGAARAVLEHDPDLFDRTTAGRWLGAFGRLLEAAAYDPGSRLSELALLGRGERQQVLVEWQGASGAEPGPRDLAGVALGRRGVEDRVAIANDATFWSYGELHRRADRIAAHLRGLGVGPERVVGVAMERRPEMVAALLGVLRAGGAYLPLDPGYPAARLALMIEDSRAVALLTDERSRERLAAAGGGAGLPAVSLAPRWPFDGEAGDAPATDDAPDGSSLAYVIYTSGSTGRPKGVAIEHRSAVALVGWALRAFGEEGLAQVAAATSTGFDLSVFELFATLAAGGTVHLVEDALHLDAGRFPAVDRVELIDTVPSVLDALLTAGRLPSAVATVNLAGEPLRADLVERVAELAPGARVVNLYGPSEDTTYSTATGALDPALGAPSIGRPVDGTRAWVVEPSGEPAPIGVAGELHLAGDGLARGYLRRPVLTAESFTPDGRSPVPGGRLYRTGDLVRHRADGRLEFLGRIDHQVKLRGFRIELGEVEAALRRTGELTEAAAAVRETGGDRRLVAYVVPAPGSGAERDPEGLRRRLAARLADELPAHAVPARFALVAALPRRPNGKLDRTALAALDPAAETSDRAPSAAGRSEIEELVAGLFAELLAVPSPGPDGDFFDLGGHSLLATRLVARLSAALGTEVPLSAVFERPTVAGLAAEAERILAGGAGLPLAPIRPREPDPGGGETALPLSFAQERLWLAERLDPGSAVYTMPFVLRLEGVLDPAALARALGAVVERHEALRTVFREVEGVPVQIVRERPTTPLPSVDLAGLPDDRREEETRRLLAAEGKRPFDLADGPLLRAMLVRLGDRRHRLGLAVHHIVFDGWSASVLVRETAELYRAFRDGGSAAALPPPPIQYADFAAWQRERLRGPVLDRLVAHWRGRLTPLPDPVLVPVQAPPDRSPSAGSPPGAVHDFALGPEVVDRLGEIARSAGATLFMVLLAGLSTLLAKVAGRTDVVVGADRAARDRVETERLIGFFVEILVLRTDLGGDPTFRRAVERVRRAALEAYAHRELPLEKVVEAVRPGRRGGSNPLFQVLFVMQNLPEASLELPGLTIETEATDPGVARFDLALFATPSAGGLDLRWDYRADLFDAATVAGLAAAFEALLARVAEAPDTRISLLDDALTHWTEAKGRRAMEADRLKSVKKFEKFRKAVPTAVAATAEVVRSRPMREGHRLPLLVEPATSDVDLAEWAAAHRERIEDWLEEHGAVLFRGFDLDGIPEFERVAEAISPGLYDEYGDLPQEDAGDKVYTSTPYPPDKTILFHNESSHLQSWPTRQFFYCSIPAAEGGETPLVDCRDLYRRLPAELVDRLAEQGLLYVRNFVPSLDVAWQDFFHTDDRGEVEAHCRRAGIEIEWRDDGGLRTRRRAPAVARHPKTGETIFFNQIALHHPSCLDPETRASLEALLGGGEMPRDVRYGDGSPIDDETVARILDAYWAEATAFPWQAHDVIAVDNMLVAHARNPFRGPRRISVAMGAMFSADELESI